MSLDAYLVFGGNCAEAMRFYEKTLGGKIEMMMTHGESPMAADTPPASKDLIIHARLKVGDRILMASDDMPGRPYGGMHGFSIALNYPKVADAKRVFDALSAGGKVDMPLQKTFWAETFAMLADKFGTPWMISGGEQMGG